VEIGKILMQRLLAGRVFRLVQPIITHTTLCKQIRKLTTLYMYWVCVSSGLAIISSRVLFSTIAQSSSYGPGKAVHAHSCICVAVICQLKKSIQFQLQFYVL